MHEDDDINTKDMNPKNKKKRREMNCENRDQEADENRSKTTPRNG